MYESLPPALSDWVSRQTERMGLPGPDHFILLVLRLEKQRQDLEHVPELYRRVFQGQPPHATVVDRTTHTPEPAHADPLERRR
jgi:hypothetical protein